MLNNVSLCSWKSKKWKNMKNKFKKVMKKLNFQKCFWREKLKIFLLMSPIKFS